MSVSVGKYKIISTFNLSALPILFVTHNAQQSVMITKSFIILLQPLMVQ